MNRILTSLILIFLPVLLLAGMTFPVNYHPIPDTIPPPPPGGPVTLYGPQEVCIGQTCDYFTEVPVGCTCQWAVNGIVQPGTSSSFTYTWNQPGIFLLAVTFICNGQNGETQALTVGVAETPDPGPIEGDPFVCEFTYHTYSIEAGSADSSAWRVNGVLQPEAGSSMTYFFEGSGNYLIEVTVHNICGNSAPETLGVTAEGTAPGEPGPIEGAEETCEGYTETYSTEVGPGESCLWWIDGVIQPTNTTTLVVSWSGWGSHEIEVRAVSDCGTGNPAFKEVLVLGDPDVFLGNDTTILQGQVLILDAGNPGSEYLWSTGETTQAIEVSLAGTYSVSVTNYCGNGYDEIEVDVSTGLSEPTMEDIQIAVSGNQVILTHLPPDIMAIQMITLDGRTVFDGKSIEKITLGIPGIYIIRIISSEKIITRKVFIH
ncbi:MAG: hypothetical protein KBC43_07525 [Bacteroidales bacterium]|nr:hypothetical protein [Bacteroidales bacterium]